MVEIRCPNTWCRGDDTSQGHYLIHSTPQGPRVIAIEKTFEKEWVRRRGGKAPDISGLNESFIEKVTPHCAPDTLTPVANGHRPVTSDNWVDLEPPHC